MKSYINIILTVFIAASAISCEDFLDNKPQGSLNDEVMNSTEGVDLLINAAYAGLEGPQAQDWGVWATPATNWSYGEVRSDNAYKGGGGVGDIFDIHKIETFEVESNNGNLDSKWYHLYCCVGRCNSALRVLNKCTEAEVPEKNLRIAEMKVLRAHFFFELVRLYGSRIPYFDENVDTPDYVNIPNNKYTRDELLDMIATEMEQAAEVLPLTQTEKGRVSRYAAYAYAGKVRLYQAYQQDENTHAVVSVNHDLMAKAGSHFDKVMAGGFDLLPDFQGLDLLENENGKESIFAVQYSMNDGSASAGRINWSNLLNSPGGNSPYHGDGFFLPSQDLINAYQTDANGLPLYDYQNIDDFSQVSFVDDNNISLTNAGHTVDPRLDFIVGRPTITWKTYTETPCMSWVRDRGVYGHNCVKRFWVSPESPDMFDGWPWGASGLNWQIIRYADVLLYKAETLIEGDGDLEQARQLINKVRRRAADSPRVKDFNDPTKDAANYLISEYPAAGWTKEYARKALRTEMRLETALEGERFFDLVRWGIADQVMNEYINAESDNRIYYQGKSFVKGRDEYFPVPVNQYNFSMGQYKQNPGYPEF